MTSPNLIKRQRLTEKEMIDRLEIIMPFLPVTNVYDKINWYKSYIRADSSIHSRILYEGMMRYNIACFPIDMSLMIFGYPQLAYDMLDNFKDEWQLYKSACEDVVGENCKAISICPVVYYTTLEMYKQPCNIRSLDVGKIRTVQGLITQITSVKRQCQIMVHICNKCGTKVYTIQEITPNPHQKLKTPKRCTDPKCMSSSLRHSPKDDVNVDTYQIVLMDAPNMQKMGVPYFSFRVLCKAHMATPMFKHTVVPGAIVELTGVVESFGVEGANTQEYYLDANNVNVLDSGTLLESLSPQNIEQLQEIAKEPNLLENLREYLFYGTVGFDDEIRSTILQSVGGNWVHETEHYIEDEQQDVKKVTDTNRLMNKLNPNIHILFIGDPGCGKSRILKDVASFAPKHRFVIGSHSTGVGLTATITKDAVSGQWTCEAGPFAIASGGVLILDEFDKMNPQHREALHSPLSDMVIAVAKANVTFSWIANTSLLAAANPTSGHWDDSRNFFEQTGMSSTLLNRFDYIWKVRLDDVLKREGDVIRTVTENKAAASMDQEMKNKWVLYKQYLQYCKNHQVKKSKKMINYINQQVEELIHKTKDAKLSRQANGREMVTSFRISGAVNRSSEALAKLKLAEEVTKEDVDEAVRLLTVSFTQTGLLQPANMSILHVETTDMSHVKSAKEIQTLILKTIRDYMIYNKEAKGISGKYLYNQVESHNVPTSSIDTQLQTLEKLGEVMQPSRDVYRLVVGV